MKQNRRDFLKFAGISALGMTVAGPLAARASGGGGHGPSVKVNADSLHAEHWGMVIDTRKLNTKEAIDKLAEACHTFHNVPTIEGKQEVKWLWAETFDHSFTDQGSPHMDEAVEHRMYPLLCNQCEHPPCVRVCPTKATFQRPDGIVIMDMHRCIGCRYCMAACPYGSRSFNFQDPRPFIDPATENKEYPTRCKGVVEKCNFCAERLAEGDMPKCVEASNGAIVFGDLGDPNSPVRKALKGNYSIRRKPTLGTQPSVYYII